jgi:hypothetical protein
MYRMETNSLASFPQCDSLFKKAENIVQRSLCPVTFSFQDRLHVNVKWSKRGRLVVTLGVRSGLRSFQDRRPCTGRRSLEHAVTCWHRPLSQALEVSSRDLPLSW